MSLIRSGLPTVLAVLLLGACQPDQASKAGDSEEETPPVPVETSVPVRGDVYAMYAGTAPIEAFAEADVIAKVGGEVRELLVEEGDEVVKGQILARLDGERLRL
jgi:membrane fusion protein (multidrug efflux system)